MFNSFSLKIFASFPILKFRIIITITTTKSKRIAMITMFTVRLFFTILPQSIVFFQRFFVIHHWNWFGGICRRS